MHIDPQEWSRIRRRILVEGETIRGVARADCLSRQTVRKMLRQSQPTRYSRRKATTPLSGYEPLIDEALLENEARPQAERRSAAAIFRTLRDEHGYRGGYSSVRRYCRNVQVPQVDLKVRAQGKAANISSLTITRGPRTYRIDFNATQGMIDASLSLCRDRRSERKAELVAWIEQVRGGTLDTPPRGDPELTTRLLRCVHDKAPRIRNRAMILLAHEQGFPLRRIANCLGVSRNTCRRYLRTCKEQGPDELLARSTRRPRSADRDDLKAAVFRILHEPPALHGINRTSWIMPDLKVALASQGFPSCLHVIRTIIHDAGWKWRKARIALTSNDPTYREKLSAVQAILSKLGSDEAFFSIDEFGPFAVRMKQGLKLDPPGLHRIVPQWQKSRGCMIMTAALELSSNQVTHFYSDRKNTSEMIRMMDVLVEQYADRRTLYLSWDAASWHVSKKLRAHIEEHNSTAAGLGRPRVATAPLPAGAQFLNVIESIFSGMAKAVIHNSDYPSADDARAAIDRYFADRNQQFRDKPRRAGKRIWGEERVPPAFADSNNCKDPRWR
jgi:transposase